MFSKSNCNTFKLILFPRFIQLFLDCVNRIQVQYGTVWSAKYGTYYGTAELNTLNSGEIITAMTLATGPFSGTGTTCVCYISMETSAGRILGPFDAGCGPGSATRYTLGEGLAYIDGTFGSGINSLVLNYISNECY